MLLTFNVYSSFPKSTQTNQLLQIYYSSKLDDSQRRDSIIKTYFKNTSPISQLEYADAIIKNAKQHNDLQWIYRGYYLKGNAYTAISELDKAYETYLKCLEAVKAGNIQSGIGDIYLGIGNTFSIGEDPKKAILYYNKALAEYKINSDSIYIGYVLLNIINEYHNSNNIDSIRYYLALTDSFLEKQNNPNIQAYLHGYTAMLYAKINKIDASLEEFKESEKLFLETGRLYDIISFQIEMTKILFKKKDFRRAKNFALECYRQAKESSLKEQVRDVSQLLSSIYEELGDFERAFMYQTEYISYKDSINNEETVRKMADLRAEYEISQKQIEIDYLEKRRSINRIALITAIAILIILFVLTYLLYRNNKIIKQQASELQELNDTKDKMFSIVSHDLRSPISSITGYFTFMKELALNKQTDKLVEISDDMTKSLQNISSLLDNLLNWATNQQGRMPYHPETFYIHEIFEQLAEMFSNAAEAKGVSIHLNINEGTQIIADKNTFATIFRNLIGNAIKFTHAGDEIAVDCKELPNKLQIAVSDTGIGISKEKLSTIFTLSNKKSTWGTANEKGVGLGLRLAYEFTEFNKGEIYVESEEGVGSTFYVEFPK